QSKIAINALFLELLGGVNALPSGGDLDQHPLGPNALLFIELDAKKFLWLLNDDAMATEKLAVGIRKFSADIVKLEKLVTSKLG
ncbi:MAG: putative transaldolase, partial [Spartobacteria bacterium]|nr:putative transaldolase [Spartobacteria bacterium]